MFTCVCVFVYACVRVCSRVYQIACNISMYSSLVTRRTLRALYSCMTLVVSDIRHHSPSEYMNYMNYMNLDPLIAQDWSMMRHQRLKHDETSRTEAYDIKAEELSRKVRVCTVIHTATPTATHINAEELFWQKTQLRLTNSPSLIHLMRHGPMIYPQNLTQFTSQCEPYRWTIWLMRQCQRYDLCDNANLQTLQHPVEFHVAH